MAWSRLMGAVGSAWASVEARTAGLGKSFADQGEAVEGGLREVGTDVWKLLVDDLVYEGASKPISPLRRQMYGHGAFMGAAPSLMADPKWRKILAFLMPDVYAHVSRAVLGGVKNSELIPMFENNPVMCAYGTLRAVLVGEALAIDATEWDVFVDSDAVALWETSPEAHRPSLIARIVDTMVIAHASATDTVQEAVGICQYKDVRKTAKTKYGGVEPAAWMDLFDRAIDLAFSPDVGPAMAEMAKDPRTTSTEECMKHTFATPRAIPPIVERFRAITGRPRFSVVIEIKSLRSTPDLLRAITVELNRRGIHVAAVGAFIFDEIRGVGAQRQTVGVEDLDGPREIQFMHFAGDLQHACDLGKVPRGHHAMFNGASLIDATPAGYKVKREVIEDLRVYRDRFDLHIGIYVQEGDCDDVAVGLLSDLVQGEPVVFDLGFAWGGLHDHVAFDGTPGDRRGYGSQKMLEQVGQAKQWTVRR